jgi:hypothetical protein
MIRLFINGVLWATFTSTQADDAFVAFNDWTGQGYQVSLMLPGSEEMVPEETDAEG